MRRCRQLKGSIMYKHLLQPQDAATTHGPRGLPVPGCAILTELTGGQHTGVGNPARTIQSKHGRCVWLLGVDTGQFGLTVFVLVHFAGFGAAAFMAPLLQNLCLSMGNNEEACFCLKVKHIDGATTAAAKAAAVYKQHTYTARHMSANTPAIATSVFCVSPAVFSTV